MNPFVQKLRRGSRLTEDDEAVLARLAEPVRRAERGDIQPEGTEPRSIVLILDGWACRYKRLDNGRRQITAVLLPGDLCEPFGVLPPFLEHTLAACSPVLLARVPPKAIRDAVQASPRIEEALWWDLLLSDAVMREHVVSLGQRSALERLGHFFCEVHFRLDIVYGADQASFEFPLKQADLGDLLGLSVVHVNRSLQELRRTGFLSLQERRLTIRDVRALREMSMFDPAYLQLDSMVRT